MYSIHCIPMFYIIRYKHFLITHKIIHHITPIPYYPKQLNTIQILTHPPVHSSSKWWISIQYWNRVVLEWVLYNHIWYLVIIILLFSSSWIKYVIYLYHVFPFLIMSNQPIIDLVQIDGLVCINCYIYGLRIPYNVLFLYGIIFTVKLCIVTVCLLIYFTGQNIFKFLFYCIIIYIFKYYYFLYYIFIIIYHLHSFISN